MSWTPGFTVPYPDPDDGDGPGGTNDVASDDLWDAAGDLAVGTGPNAATRLPKGTSGQVLSVSGGGDVEWGTPSGSGDMLAANNLSDVDNVATARTNLGLGSAAQSNTGDFATATQGATADTALQPAAIGVTVQGYDADLTDLAGIADAQGDIIIRGAAGWERLAKSATSTDVLTAGASQPGWAAATGGASSGAALGMIDATDEGVVCDGRSVTDGVCTVSSTTVTSATAAFVAGDVGKTINITKADRAVTDAAITATLTALTSATAAFTAADVGKTVHIDGAGAAGVALSTTIAAYVSATEVTLTLAASTTVSAARLFVRTPPHQTTIASVTNGTTAVLTAAPSYTLTGATFLLGTENRAAFTTAVAAAVAAQKALYIPPGTGFALISLTSANKTGAATFNNDLRVVGSGRGQSRIVVATDGLVSSGTYSLFLPGSNTTAPVRFDLEDITVDYIGVTPNQNGYGPYLALGTPTNRGEKIRLRNVDSSGFPMGVIVQGSSGANTRLLELVNTSLTCQFQALSLFTDTASAQTGKAWTRSGTTVTVTYTGHGLNVGESVIITASTETVPLPNATYTITAATADTFSIVGVDSGAASGTCSVTRSAIPYDAVLRIRDSRVEVTATATTQTNDSGYNGHNIYIHPSVSVDIDGLVTKAATSATGQYHVHVNGSPTEPIKFFTIRNWRTDQDATTPGYGSALLHARNALATYGHSTVESCNFEHIRQGIVLGSTPITVTDSQFRTRGPAVTGGSGTAVIRRFDGCLFNNEVTTANDTMVAISGSESTWEFNGCRFILVTGTGDCFAVTSTGSEVLVDGGLVYSVSGAGGAFCESVKYTFTINNTVFGGVWGDTILGVGTGDSTHNLVLSNNKFRQTSGAVIRNNRALALDNIRGWDNIVPSNALGFTPSTGSGAIVPPRRKSATAIASAAQIDVTWNHDSFDISGTTTINNIYCGGTAAANRLRGGDLYLTATGAWTLAHNAPGNIRTVSGANRVMVSGETVHLRADPSTNLWYEIGSPGTAGSGTAIIGDWSALGNLGATETVTGVDNTLVRSAGTLDQACAITIVTTADQIVDLQVTQDGTGGRAVTFSGVDVWHTTSGGAPSLTNRAAGSVDRFFFEDIAGTCFGYWPTETPPSEISARMPTGAVATTFPRYGAVQGNLASQLVSGRLSLAAVDLRAGQVVTTITWVSGTTALATGSNQWFALFDSALGKLDVTNDDTSAAWAANTAKTLTLTTPYTVLATDRYYIGCCVVATTVPTLTGAATSSTSAISSIAPVLYGSSTTGLTNPASCPSTAAAIVVVNGWPWAYCS